MNSEAFSRDISASIQFSDSSKSIVKIEGKFVNKKSVIKQNWSFLQSYADAENLGRRISNFTLFDSAGNVITVKKFAEGEFVADREAVGFSYKVDLSIPENNSLMAHISWLDKTKGLLMLNDLLPQFEGEKVSAQIELKLPNDWQVSGGNRNVLVEDVGRSVIAIGQNWREKEFSVKNTKVSFIISGEWKFEDVDAAEMASSILGEYDDIFGEIPFEQANIYLVRFPKEVEFGRWRAETRGANTVILSSSMPFKNQAVQRLHEQLRHELFHYWIPNSLNLSGDYAWFYEGFAVYQALKTGVWTNQIRFEDFLNTLGQAYNIVNRVERKFSLIETSKNRWQGASGGSVYSKGLLTAFLCDVELLKKSKGKRDVKNIFQTIYRKHNRSAVIKNANESILETLNSFEELNFIVERHIKGTEKIDLENYLNSIGVENAGNSSNAEFKLKKKLRGREKAILKKLGYNRWREILRESK